MLKNLQPNAAKAAYYRRGYGREENCVGGEVSTVCCSFFATVPGVFRSKLKSSLADKKNLKRSN